MKSYPSLETYPALLSLLSSPDGATLEDLQQLLQRSKRTVQRILAALKHSGVALVARPDPSGNTCAKRWYIGGAQTAPPSLTSHPSLALELRLAVSRFGRYALAPTQALTTLAKKTVGNAITDGLARPALYGERYFYSTRKGIKDYSAKALIVEQLYEAVCAQRVAFVCYRAAKSSADKSYAIYPLTIVEHQNALYVIVMVPKHENSICTLAIERIQDLRLEPGEYFERPTGFHPTQIFKETFGIISDAVERYVIRFAKEVAIYGTERVWSTTQSVEQLPTGEARLRFEAQGYQEIKNWVLSFGASAFVEAPECLQHEILLEARAIIQRSTEEKEKDDA